MSYRSNAIDQFLDIAGSLFQTAGLTLADEPNQLGSSITGQTGAAATVASVATGIATITGLTGMTADSVGHFLQISGAATVGNNGTFLITSYVSATSVTIANVAAAAPDANDGALAWEERNAYSLQDDLNFARTDRQAIKGVAYSAAIPTFERPTAIGTAVPANLANLAGKTTDAQGFVFNRAIRAQTVAATDTLITITSAGNLRHSDAVNKTGVPCFDVAPYVGDSNACYVMITDPVNSGELTAVGGAADGYVIFGLTQAGSSTSPNSVEVKFKAVQHGHNLADAIDYTWDASQPTTVDLTYGYFLPLDQADENSFRRLQVLGIESDADLRQDVDQLQEVVGTTDGSLSLATFLTNTVNYYPFGDLGTATPSVVNALNTLNQQIGDRTYTGSILTSGDTIVESLQLLADAIVGSNLTRVVERLAADIPANSAHTLPGAMTYAADNTNNGSNLWVFTRGVLRDPGSVANGDDYQETSTTSITFFTRMRAGDHINYIKRT
jgi:hypothetical protein